MLLDWGSGMLLDWGFWIAGLRLLDADGTTASADFFDGELVLDGITDFSSLEL
jgi:hypothetical protein